MSEDLPKIDEAALQSEAASVERLRRHIAEMPSKGEVATPQLLAQFAVAQKRYLDRKIQFEKQRRGSALSSAPGSGVRPKVQPASVAPVSVLITETKPETKVPVKAETLPVPAKPAEPAKVAEPQVAAAKAETAPTAPERVPVPQTAPVETRKALPVFWIVAAVAAGLALAAWFLVFK